MFVGVLFVLFNREDPICLRGVLVIQIRAKDIYFGTTFWSCYVE